MKKPLTIQKYYGQKEGPQMEGRTNQHGKVYSRVSMTNSSPKGNMWSAIPVALLCMIVNWSERKQGSGPEGDEVL